MKNRVKYTVEKILNNSFYQMPKFLFEGEFIDLSNDARVLYMLLKDRHELSLKNKWFNDKGEVYLIMKREEMESMLNLAPLTVRKILKELKALNLIEEERRGLNKPNLLYLLECQNVTLRTVKKLHSGTSNSNTLNRQNFSPINTNSNKTNLSKNDLINLSPNPLVDNSENKMIDGLIDNTIITSDIINNVIDNLHIDSLITRYPTKETNINELRSVIIEVLKSDKKEYKISGETIPDKDLKQSLLQLDSGHLEYILDSFKNTDTQIKNIKNYLIKTLYNAPKTINNYYTQQVNHDMNNGKL